MGDQRPNPLSDAVKGLGLLLRAAKTVVEKIPTKNLEEAVVTSAREVGRAIENVASTIEREVRDKLDEGRGRPKDPGGDAGRPKANPDDDDAHKPPE